MSNIVLVEKSKVAQQSKVDQQNAKSQKNAGGCEKFTVEITEFNAHFAHCSENYENIVDLK